MPLDRLGRQQITFAIEKDNADNQEWIWHNVRKGDTVARIAADRGHPELARAIADANGIRNVRSVLGRSRVRVPGKARAADAFDVVAGERPPTIVDGYAQFEVTDRPGRAGLTTFTGYQPMVMEVDVIFSSDDVTAGWSSKESADVEEAIRLLERMAGRGRGFSGASTGPPPVIRASTTNAQGAVVPLIPHNYQSSAQNPSAPLWRVAGIDWGRAERNRYGGRIYQEATIRLQQHVRVNLLSRSAAERAKSTKKGWQSKKTGPSGGVLYR